MTEKLHLGIFKLKQIKEEIWKKSEGSGGGNIWPISNKDKNYIRLFSSEAMQTWRPWNEVFKVVRQENLTQDSCKIILQK